MTDAWHDFHYTLHGRDVRIIPQLDGSQYGGLNCGAATAAEHILSETTGIYPGKGSPWPPTGASFRLASHDTSGGLLASTVDETSNRVYGIDPDFQIASSDVVLAKLRAGYGATQLRWEGPIVDAGFIGSPGFRENHSSYLAGAHGTGSAIRIVDCNPLYDGRHANTPLGPQEVPWRAIVRASELLVVSDTGARMIDRYGAGRMYVGLTRVPYRPGVPVPQIKRSVLFGDGSFYVYRVTNGVITGRDAKRFSKRTSAPCYAAHVYKWPGHLSRRLVRIAAGALKDEYVAVNQGSAVLKETEV